MSDSTKPSKHLPIRNTSGALSPTSKPTRFPAGLSEDVVRLISAKKNEPEWLLEWRLKAYRHWLTMKEPEWANVHYPKIDYQDIIYYSAPKTKGDGPRAWTKSTPTARDLREARHPAAGTARCWPASPWTPSSTASPSPPPSRPSCTNSASSSARFPKPCKSIPSW